KTLASRHCFARYSPSRRLRTRFAPSGRLAAMVEPRVVIIPFGVPDEGRGLGLGLAALVHAFCQVDGGGLAIAQLHVRRVHEGDGSGVSPTTDNRTPAPVEAFVPPAAWRDIAGRGEAPTGVRLVLTGAFEPPDDGSGALQLLAFDA